MQRSNAVEPPITRRNLSDSESTAVRRSDWMLAQARRGSCPEFEDDSTLLGVPTVYLHTVDLARGDITYDEDDDLWDDVPAVSGTRYAAPSVSTLHYFIASLDGSAVGAMCLRLDGPMGLRADRSYRQWLDGLRDEGIRLCELVGTAQDEGKGRRGTHAALNRALTESLARLSVDRVVVPVRAHPEETAIAFSELRRAAPDPWSNSVAQFAWAKSHFSMSLPGTTALYLP